jgi:hypothetical protein
LLTSPGLAQSGSALPGSLATIADNTDRTGTNPANLKNTLDLVSEFRSYGAGVFFDDIRWRYWQSVAAHRMRVRAELPLSFANLTGRLEAGLGDVLLGWEWVPLVHGRIAWLAGADVSFDSSTNEALAAGHHVVAPSVGVVHAPRRNVVLAVRYFQRTSFGSAGDRPDHHDTIIDGAVVRRFGDGTWVRASPTLVVDYENDRVSGRVYGEWGRLLTGGVSTWVRGGPVLGSRPSRPFDWALQVGFRFVQ